MSKWVLLLLVLIGLYALSMGPLVGHYSHKSGKKVMVPTWLRNYGGPYLWAYANSPKPVQELSDSYFRWCKDKLAKSEGQLENLKTQGAPNKPPPIFGF